MFAMAASAMYHLLQDGRFDALGIVAGSVEGFALVTRQYLAMRDVRGLCPTGWPNASRTSANWPTPTR